MSADSSLKELGAALVLGVQVYLRALRTYESNNAMVLRARKQLLDLLSEHFKTSKQPLNLQFLEGETFVNADLLPLDFQTFLRAQELTRLLRGFDVGEITFHPTVDETGLEQLAQAVYACIHQDEEKLPSKLNGINLRPLHSSGVGASGAEIHKVCVWLFAGLLNAVETLGELHEEGQTPTMLPFKRHLRLMAEIMNERPTVFQLLCARRPQQLDSSDNLHHTIRTVESVGFGVNLGLSRAALMTLGLSSTLDRITCFQGSLAVFEMLSKFHSLGDMAPGVMMTLWDLELIRNGGKGGRLAQILHVVDNYVTLSQKDGSDSVSSEVWPRLQRAVPSSRTLITSLQAWKGKVPLGTLIHIEDEGQFIALDFADDEGLPRFSEFNEWGILSEPTAGLKVPKGTPSGFGRAHLLQLPSESAQAVAATNTTAPFRVIGTQEESSLEEGALFGGRDGKRFLVECEAGKGGQALVYKVRDNRLGRMAAAKVSTASESSMRKLLMERFEHELLLGSRVSHPHVLQVYDCGELDGGTPYVLLEWMDRGDLVDLLDTAWAIRQNLPLAHIHYYATCIASALRAIHAAQIVHRDIKPDNILLRFDGVPKLTDFGVAKDISEGAPTLTEVGQTMGTLGFMAPEQLLGLPGPQSDIFSYGITFYRLICAKIPPQVMVNSIPVGRILDEAWDDVPSTWVPFLKKLTEPELADRAQDFDEVLDMLRELDPTEADDRPLLALEHLPPLPSAEFNAVSGTQPPSMTSTGSFARISSPRIKKGPIEETIALNTVEEAMSFPGDLREGDEDSPEISETLDLSEEQAASTASTDLSVDMESWDDEESEDEREESEGDDEESEGEDDDEEYEDDDEEYEDDDEEYEDDDEEYEDDDEEEEEEGNKNTDAASSDAPSS